MRAKDLTNFLEFAVINRFPVLIKGKPGIGKSDIVSQVATKTGANLIISHPVVSDPTDYKGLPFPIDGKADFLPFGELLQLINATSLTIYFLDDLGQAPASVQAACMQLLLARQINGHKVSEHVTFIAATNRREDRAAVNGLLEPVKSRFNSIVELEVNTDDWVLWALNNGMPVELISFIQFRPQLLDNFEPSKDIVNSPMPRTVSNVGKMLNAKLPESLMFEAIKGAAGESFSIEFIAYLKVYQKLPSVNEILLNPMTARVPEEIAGKYAICGAIAEKLTAQTIGSFLQYLERLPDELSVCCLKNGCNEKPVNLYDT